MRAQDDADYQMEKRYQALLPSFCMVGQLLLRDGSSGVDRMCVWSLELLPSVAWTLTGGQIDLLIYFYVRSGRTLYHHSLVNAIEERWKWSDFYSKNNKNNIKTI